MGHEGIYVGIDVAKAKVDVAVRPTSQRWVVSYDETGVAELVSQLEGLGPTLVLWVPPWSCWRLPVRFARTIVGGIVSGWLEV